MFLDRTSSGFDLEVHVGAAFFLALLRAELRLALGADGTIDLRGALPEVADAARYMHIHAASAKLSVGPPLSVQVGLRLCLGPYPLMASGAASGLNRALGAEVAKGPQPTLSTPKPTSTAARAAVSPAPSVARPRRPGRAPQGPEPRSTPSGPSAAPTPPPPAVIGVDLTLVIILRLSDLGVELRLGGERDLRTAVSRWATPSLGAPAASTLAASLIALVNGALERAGTIAIPGLSKVDGFAWRALPSGDDTLAALALLGNLPLELPGYSDAGYRPAESPLYRLEAVDRENLRVMEAVAHSARPGAAPTITGWRPADPRSLRPAARAAACGPVDERSNWVLQAIDGEKLRFLYADGGVVPSAEVLALRERGARRAPTRGDPAAARSSLPPGVPLRLAVSPLTRARLRAAMAPVLARKITSDSKDDTRLSLHELAIDWHAAPLPGRITLRVRVKVEEDMSLFTADGIATYVQDIDLRVVDGRLSPIIGEGRLDTDGWLDLWGGVMDFFTAGLRAVGHDIDTFDDLVESARGEAHAAVATGVLDALSVVPVAVEYSRGAPSEGVGPMWCAFPIQHLRLEGGGAALHFDVVMQGSPPPTGAMRTGRAPLRRA